MKELGIVHILNVDCSRQPEIDHVEYIASLLAIETLEELKIIGDRLKVQSDHSLNGIRKLSIECTDISSKIFDALSKSKQLEYLLVSTKAFITGRDLSKLKNLKKLKKFYFKRLFIKFLAYFFNFKPIFCK